MITVEQQTFTPSFPIHWEARLEMPNLQVGLRREIAHSLGLAAVFFTPDDIKGFIEWVTHKEYEEGHAGSDRYVAVKEGGMPLFTDIMTSWLGAHIPKRDTLKTKTYHGTSAGEVKLVVPPSQLSAGESVTLVEDGIDTNRTLASLGSLLPDRFGVRSLRAIVALTKQDELKVPGYDEIIAGFKTPYGAWGEGYGFDNSGVNRNLRVIGLSMKQAPENFGIVQDVLAKLNGIAVATIDDIVRYNSL